jgi:hypothetical protein
MFLPNRECQEQAARTAIEKASTDLDEEGCTNRTSDTDELNVSGFQFSVRQVDAGLEAGSLEAILRLPSKTITGLERGHDGLFARASADSLTAGRIGSHAAGDGCLIGGMRCWMFLVVVVRHGECRKNKTWREMAEMKNSWGSSCPKYTDWIIDERA